VLPWLRRFGLRQTILNKIDPESLPLDALPTDYRTSRLQSSFESSLHNSFYNSSAVNHAIDANDDSLISDEDREVRVRAAMKELGWDDVVFTD
jgi:hypothetical protein